MVVKQRRFTTKFVSAGEIMSRVSNTHLQVSKTLIVPKKAIVDIFESMGVVCFSDGSAEYFDNEFRDDLIAYYRTRPKCGCGVYFKRTDDDRKNWICRTCSSIKKIKENYG
jgi:hypothetical protein